MQVFFESKSDQERIDTDLTELGLPLFQEKAMRRFSYYKVYGVNESILTALLSPIPLFQAVRDARDLVDILQTQASTAQPGGDTATGLATYLASSPAWKAICEPAAPEKGSTKKNENADAVVLVSALSILRLIFDKDEGLWYKPETLPFDRYAP
jgi:predicted RNA-binding Zn ribbon-like protein